MCGNFRLLILDICIEFTANDDKSNKFGLKHAYFPSSGPNDSYVYVNHSTVGSDNGLSRVRRHFAIETNDD